MSTPFHLLLPRQFYMAMLAQAQAELPNECCGLLAGRMPAEGGVALVERIFPLVNAVASPVEYLSEPKSLLAAHKAMRPEGLEVLAVYHSHPTSPPIPSRKDREQSYSNEVVHFIISLQESVPVMEGWWLTEESYLKAGWEVMVEAAAGQIGAKNGVGDMRSER